MITVCLLVDRMKPRLMGDAGGLKPARVAFAPLLTDENEDDDMDPSLDEDTSHKRKDPPE